MTQNAERQKPTYARSIRDAGACIGISRAGMYRLIAAKEIATFRIKGRVLVAESEIQRFIADRTGATA